MTCFIPSLEPGTNFHISIHCWGVPQLSQYTLNYSKHPELVKFEARILIDGPQVASVLSLTALPNTPTSTPRLWWLELIDLCAQLDLL